MTPTSSSSSEAKHASKTTPEPTVEWDTDEPSLRGIDGIERMRIIRDDIAARVTTLATNLNAT